jgi:hypothetical protein
MHILAQASAIADDVDDGGEPEIERLRRLVGLIERDSPGSWLREALCRIERDLDIVAVRTALAYQLTELPQAQIGEFRILHSHLEEALRAFKRLRALAAMEAS